MQNKRLLVTGIAALFVLNVVLLWWYRSRPNVTVQRERPLDEVQTERLVEWNSQEVVLLTSSELRDAVAAACQRPCGEAPLGAAPRESDSLPMSQTDDLVDAIVGLLRSYTGDGAMPVIGFMESRNHVLSSSRVERIRGLLAEEGGKDRQQLDDLSDNEVYALMWTTLDVQTHWEGIVADSCCVSIFSSGDLGAANLRDTAALVQPEYQVWRGMRSVSPNFVPRDAQTIESRIESGPVLIADAKLVLQHDSTLLKQKAPYLIRFWFNPEFDQWQPMLLVQVDVFDGAPSRLMF